jgi:chitinase
MWVQGYYPKSRIAAPTPANLPWDKLSHLTYFNLAPTATGGLVDTAGISLATDLPTITGLAHAAGVKVLVTVGGASAASDATWRDAVSSTYRATFVAAIASYVSTYDLDGIDIDWEPFDTEADGVDFALFIAALRVALPSPKIITVFTATTPAWKQTLANTIQANVDRINLSTYDFSYAESLTVHDSPVYSTGSQPATQSVDGAVSAFIGAGLSASKLGVGTSQYAQEWAGETALYEAATPNAFSAVTYQSLAGASSTTEPTGSTYDTTAQAAYITGDPFTSTPSVQNVKDKVTYVKENALGGIFIWELGQAYFSSTFPHFPLLEPFSGIRSNAGNKNVETWLATNCMGFGIAATSQTFTVGRVLLTEFSVKNPVVVDAITYPVFATSAGDVTVGIYGPIGTRETSTGAALIVQSASTAQGTANTPQTITIADTLLQPGTYYVALEGSDATGTYARNTNQTQIVGFGAFYDRGGGYGALTDPAPATTTTGSALPGMKIRVKAT